MIVLASLALLALYYSIIHAHTCHNSQVVCWACCQSHVYDLYLVGHRCCARAFFHRYHAREEENKRELALVKQREIDAHLDDVAVKKVSFVVEGADTQMTNV